MTPTKKHGIKHQKRKNFKYSDKKSRTLKKALFQAAAKHFQLFYFPIWTLNSC